MLAITPFLESARNLDAAEFCAKHAGFFLLKRPQRGWRADGAASFGFETVAGKMDVDPFGDQWRIAQVEKREGNPFPERMTVGRANNCDVILRLPFVSKVHAHILKDSVGAFRIHDNRAANRTFYQHRPLAADATQRLNIGDALGFGSLEVEFVDAARLYNILRAEAVDVKLSRGP